MTKTSDLDLSTQYSTAPNGEQFPLPTPQDEAVEILRLQSLVADHRAQGHEIVVVLGVEEIGGHDPNSQNSGSCPPISPAKAGAQKILKRLDTVFRRYDDLLSFARNSKLSPQKYGDTIALF